MNRREFLKWALGAAGAIGLGRFLGNFFAVKSSVTVLDFPDFNCDLYREIARIIESDGLVLKGKKVLLKPNFVEYHEGRPINTDIHVIKQVAEACLFLGASEVAVGEAAGHRRDPWYSVYHPSLREVLPKKVRCIDLNHGNVYKVPNKGFYTDLPHFFVAAPVMDADVVINLPKMKTHHWVGVTLSLKNLFGVLPGIFYGWPKNLLHIKGIEDSILDLALTIPVHYVVLDGVIGMEGDGPILGTPKRIGALIMGKAPLAVDCTAARMMGFDPYKIYYLARAVLHLPGLHDSTTIQKGENPRKYAKPFEALSVFSKIRGGPFWP